MWREQRVLRLYPEEENGEAIIGSITLPFEVMELIQLSISNVSEYLSHSENWQSFLPLSKAEQLHSIFKKSMHMNPLQTFCIAALVRVEEHFFYIGVKDSGIPKGPVYNKYNYSYCVLDTMEQFANAAKEAISVVDKFDSKQGSVRKRIELKTPSEDMFSRSPHAESLIGVLSPLNPSNQCSFDFLYLDY